MKKKNIRCPSCNSDKTSTEGTIPPSIYFAGQRLKQPIPGGELFQCRHCYLKFRYPRLPEDEQSRLYGLASDDNWRYQPLSRIDWQIAKKQIEQCCNRGRLLDIGCFDGAFLAFMGEAYECYGIEINGKAANRARARNVEIIGEDFNNIGKLTFDFDVVVAMDVIEHAEDPAGLLNSMASVVRPGGFLMLSTGNTASWSWRLMGSRYWYCTVAEHISFINPKWCEQVAPAANLEVVGFECFAHAGDVSLPRRMADLGKNLIYRFFPRTVAWLRSRGLGGVDAMSHKSLASTPPMWFSAADHFIVVFQKT